MKRVHTDMIKKIWLEDMFVGFIDIFLVFFVLHFNFEFLGFLLLLKMS